MTANETTARDRAIGRLTRWMNGGRYDATNLRADVSEVLRALAAAPDEIAARCADELLSGTRAARDSWRDEALAHRAAIKRVREFLAENGTQLLPGTDEVVTKGLHGETTARDRAIEKTRAMATAYRRIWSTQDEADALEGTLAELDRLRALAAAPDEIADLSCRFCGNAVEVITDRDSAGCGDIECVQCGARWDGRTGNLQWSNVMPLTSDLTDDEPEGMDLEAQGEMSDQLDAAQAAIQRVREFLAENSTQLMPGTDEVVTKAGVLRALDGDTAEEQR